MLRGPTGDPAENEPRERDLLLSHVPSPLSSRGSLRGERGPCGPDKALEVGLLCPAPAGSAISPAASPSPWLRAMALQVGKTAAVGAFICWRRKSRGI